MRVVVTGLGIVSPLGVGLAATTAGLLAGRCAIVPITRGDLAGARVVTAGEVRDLAPGPGSRAERLALLAAGEALGDLDAGARGTTALFVGGTTGGMAEAEASLAALTADPTAEHDALAMATHALGAPADRVARDLGPFAEVHTVCSACSGGALAIALAAASIRSGRVERALAGGVDALGRMTLAGFAALSALDAAPCRPFDATRAGLSLGEGAAFLLLEREDVARARGARVLVELAGWAIAAEAHHETQPAPDGRVVAATMARALARGGLTARDVGYVNAHGTATPANDAVEAAAIASVLGRVPVSSLKGSIGHALAAAGAIEAVVTSWSVAEGVAPPTVGLTEVDPGCAAVDHVRAPRRGRIEAALTSSFGFGGTDVVLALRADGAAAAPSPGRPAPSLVITGVSLLGPRGRGADPRGYLDGGSGDGPDPIDAPLAAPTASLDGLRARRFGRASRLATLVAGDVLVDGPDRAATGIVVGSAFGSVEATGALLRQIAEKGPRFASPAVFPSVLPSALASHPSIYLGLRGPAFACADLGASAESALFLGALILDDHQAEAVVVAAVEEHSAVATAVSSPSNSGLRGPARGEGAAALLLEPAEAARRRGARARAVLAARHAWRGARPPLPGPGSTRAATVVARPHLEAPPGWPPSRSVRRAGDHEAVGGAALVAAVALLDAGEVDEVLVLGDAPDRGYAFLLVRPTDHLPAAPEGAPGS